MKIRIGFVSNSSVCSFCIYGWSEKDLNKGFGEMLSFCKELSQKYKDVKMTWTSNSKDVAILGVGNIVSDGPWDYSEKSRCPAENEKRKLEKIAKEIGLPKPKLFSETFCS